MKTSDVGRQTSVFRKSDSTLHPTVLLPIESGQVPNQPHPAPLLKGEGAQRFLEKSKVPGARLLVLLSVVCCLMSLSSCGVYSFTGASIAPDIKTVTILNFGNQSENGNTAISQTLTDLLKNKFLTETNLTLTNSGGDVEFIGTITGYSIRGQAPTADQTTALNRLTITAKVDYVNNIDEKQNWSQVFSRYADYESTQNLADVETQLMTDINTQIAEDIFNKAFVNW